MPTIAAFGDVDIDLLVEVEGYPPRGGETLAGTSRSLLGGSAVNTAVWLTRLGFSVTLLGQVGDDEFGHRAVTALREAAVDTSFISTSEVDPTGMNVLIVTPDGERTMIGVPGANRTCRGSPGWDRGCEWLHLSAYALIEEPQRTAALAAAEVARTRSLPISIDIPSGVAEALGQGLFEILTGCAVVAVGEQSLGGVTSAGVAGLLDAGVETVAVTAGDGPFTVYRGDDSVTITPPPVEVVDTTGAGDAFVAGLVASRRWDLQLGPAATLAALLGAVAVGVRGAGNEEKIDLVECLAAVRWLDADPAWVDEIRRAITAP